MLNRINQQTSPVLAPPVEALTNPPSKTPGELAQQKLCVQSATTRQTLNQKMLSAENFNAEIASRIEWLLAKKFEPCQNEKTSYANCFGTALWVLGLGNTDAPAMYAETDDNQWEACDNTDIRLNLGSSDNLDYLFRSIGYQPIESHEMIQVIKEGSIVEPCEVQPNGDCTYIEIPPELKIEQAKDALINLKPGDLLLFGTSGEIFDGEQIGVNFSHAAIYVGNVNGEPMMFEKRSLYCGPDSPYAIVPVMNRIRGDAESLTKGAGDITRFLHVYRRKM